MFIHTFCFYMGGVERVNTLHCPSGSRRKSGENHHRPPEHTTCGGVTEYIPSGTEEGSRASIAPRVP